MPPAIPRPPNRQRAKIRLMHNSAGHPSVFALLKSTFAAWSKDRALNLSAALAYYSIFSIAPLLIIAVSIAGLIFGSDAAQGRLDDQLKIYIGAEAAAVCRPWSKAPRSRVTDGSEPGSDS